MYAIIKTGGKQFMINEGDVLSIEKLDAAVGEKIVFEEVLAISNESGLNVGVPVVAGAKVEATVLEVGRDKKVIVYNYKPKKDYKKKQGHRQPFTKVVINKING